MQIIIEDLRTGPNKYLYSEQVEEAIRDIVVNTFSIKEYSQVTTGYDPYKDFSINGHMIDLKISGKDDLEIEYARDNGDPSAIALTDCDLYMTLTGGWNKIGRGWDHVGKLRLFRVSQLKEIIEPLKDDDKYCKYYKPHDGGRGSRCVVLTKNMIKDFDDFDLALFDIEPIKNNKDRIIGYDLNKRSAAGAFSYITRNIYKSWWLG